VQRINCRLAFEDIPVLAVKFHDACVCREIHHAPFVLGYIKAYVVKMLLRWRIV
jgi:hypothetical protein